MEVIRFLVARNENKREINERDETGRTPLSLAAWSPRQAATQIAAILLATGRVDVDFRSEGGRTPLTYAIGSGNMGMMRLLVEAGADMRAVVRRSDEDSLAVIDSLPFIPEEKAVIMAKIKRLWNSHVEEHDETQAVTSGA